MNEFTKEELVYLASCPSVRCYQGLIDKLQYMIDNYDKPVPYMSLRLSDGTKIKCRELMIQGPCGGGGAYSSGIGSNFSASFSQDISIDNGETIHE